MITCDEIISAMNIVSTKKKNTIGTNVKKYIIVKKLKIAIFCINFISAIILLFIIIIVCYRYAKQKGIYKKKVMHKTKM